MIAFIKAWWKARGERLCNGGDHDWGESVSAEKMFPDRSPFEHMINLTGYWRFSRCRRCHVLGRSLADS